MRGRVRQAKETVVSHPRLPTAQVKGKTTAYVQGMLRSNTIHARRFFVGNAVLISRDFDRNSKTRRTKFTMTFDQLGDVVEAGVGGDNSMYRVRLQNGDVVVKHSRCLKLHVGARPPATDPDKTGAPGPATRVTPSGSPVSTPPSSPGSPPSSPPGSPPSSSDLDGLSSQDSNVIVVSQSTPL